MRKEISDKGISFMLVFGSYGGFFIENRYTSFHICLGWMAFTVFYYDVENAITKILKTRDSGKAIDKILNK